MKDWEIEARGIDKVLEANKNIFENIESIKVKPLRIYHDENFIIAELEIKINEGGEILFVIDVIEYDSNGRISSIRAYKG